MIIKMKKFGTTLTSRQMGREAFLAFQTALSGKKIGEKIEIDFRGVLTFSPSWGDEFLNPLLEKFGEGITFKNTDNLSVKATLEMLQEISKKKFNIIK
jgi:hypothetical protein